MKSTKSESSGSSKDGVKKRKIDKFRPCILPTAYKRDPNEVPFHIPHKKLLEKIEFKKTIPEPLTGLKKLQDDILEEKERARQTEVVAQLKPNKDEELVERIDYPSTKQQRKSRFDDHIKIQLPAQEGVDEKPQKPQIQRPTLNIVDQLKLIKKMRNVTDGSFVYLMYAVPTSSELYFPYAMTLATYKELDKTTFFTMSSEGVMQYLDTEMIFTPLEKWEQEYVMYCKLMKIRWFRNYRKWKTFFTWRNNIIRKKKKVVIRHLNENLLCLNPTLYEGMRSVQDMCYEMTDVNFLDLRDIESRWLFYLVEDQMDKLDQVGQKLEDYYNLAKELVSTTCHRALLDRKFVPDERIEEEEMAKKKKRHKKSTYIEQAAKKKFCERLSSFIMLMDYMTNTLLHKLIVNSVEEVYNIITKYVETLPREELKNKTPLPEYTLPKLPIFEVSLIVEAEFLAIDPGYEVMVDIFKQLYELWEVRCKRVKSFVADPYYSIFTTPVINYKVEDRIVGWGPTVDYIFDHDDHLAELKSFIMDNVELNYLASNLYKERFEDLRKFYKEDLQVQEEDIKNERNLEKFRYMCTRYAEEIQIIEDIEDTQPLGILNIKLEKMKEQALPEPNRLLGIVRNVLPWIGKTKVDELFEESEEIQNYLLQEPVQTVDYVKYLEYIEGSTEKVDKLEAGLEYCKELYDIAEEHHVTINNEELQTYLGLSVILGDVRNLVDKKIEETGKIIQTFNKQMNKDIGALISEVGNIRDECMQAWLLDIQSDKTEVIEFLKDLDSRLKACQDRATEYKNYQKQFRLEVTRFEILDEVMADVKLRMLLWNSVDEWAQTVNEWYNVDFSTLNIDDMNMFTAKYLKYINQLEKGLPQNLLVPKLRDQVELMKDKLPIIAFLRNPAMRPRHWMKVEKLLNRKFRADEVKTLNMLERLNVFSYPNELQDVSGEASSEAGLEALLKKVEDAWKTLEYIVVQHKDTKDVYILGSLEDVQAVLDESNINISTIASSRYVGPIKQRVEEWSKNLDLFSRTLDEWLTCQQNWLYLEVIFSAPDIQRQLPDEAVMFNMVDKSFKEIMRQTAKMPLAMEATLVPGLLESLQRNNELLDQIMKCLESYLETKRVAFPRFYFLSNDELLSILAQTRNPHAVQPHLRKCFDAIAKLEFGVKVPDEEDEEKKKRGGAAAPVLTTDIIAMISPEGERVQLGKGLKARGNVEDWLGKVETSMVLSLKRLLKQALTHYMNCPRTEWVLSHCNQITLTVSQIMWAKGVHEILDGKSDQIQMKLEQYEQKCINDLNDLAQVIQGDLSSVTRRILIALITIDVHARDTVNNLVNGKVRNSYCFEWLKVLRYYWQEDIDDCCAKMSSASYFYGYEYLGAGGVLVITPLTDKCYLCLMGALQLDLGGSPAGPAGTGKTETTKDLAKALAIQCVVFNCSEGLDFKMMGRFFSGLAQSGAWCCFDEFNRIDIEVLSVIAQQLITIRNAKAAKLEKFMFEGREIKLVQRCSAFITMNPGYAGRTELPDNLKALFRPIAMMVPDYALIAEVILYSEGFRSSKPLSQKMVQMYKLCSEQLSQQDHYDFGMRAVKSVLVMAGSLKRANPERNEDVVLICALRDSNLPKFLTDDSILFKGILGDLFPGVELPVTDYGIFEETIKECMVTDLLQPEECIIHKVIQLYETMIVRWGVMLVGPTGGGKSTILTVLNETVTKMFDNGIEGLFYRPVRTYTLNPKAVTAGELYGEFNALTLEWKDGLMGIMMRTAVGFTTEEHQWIICDGPVDAVWIENLNTVLDDNKMLCLANSERIKLTDWVHMVFEVQDLAQASPATVSRCGMVFVDSEELKWLPYVKTWIAKVEENLLSQELKDYLLVLFESVVEAGFNFVKKKCHWSIHQVDIGKAKMICCLIESYLKMPGSMEKIGEKRRVRTYLCQIFLLSYLWGIGGNLYDESREMFEIFVKDQFEENPDARIPAGVDLWSLNIDVKGHKLESWVKIIPTFNYDPSVPFFETLVPTIDTVRFGYIMERLIYINQPVFVTGDTGVGKSVVTKEVLNTMAESNLFVPGTMNFSAQTSSSRTQEIIELKLEKKKKTLLGAPMGKKVIIFVDDVNMPKLDTYGSQPPIELLRQLLDYGGLYDRDKLFWKEIQDVILMVACAPPGGGRNPLTPRFVRHFGMLLIPPPNEFALKAIFKAILKGFLSTFTNEVRDLGDYMVNAAVEIYERIATDLLPTPAKSHYVFNLRDLSKCVQGITQADPGTLRTENAMLRLFYHECLRVFHDRLINAEDKSYFYYLMKDVCQKNFNTGVLTLPDDGVITTPPVLLYGDFMQIGAEKQNRLYEELKDIEKVKVVLQDYLDDYNLMTTKDMRVIFFMMAIEHCVRIARILRSERGNALLVGVSGMGKQSLTRLASHLNQYKCCQIELTRNYDHDHFFDDLRRMYRNAGCDNLDTVFLFTDTQIVQEEFLEDINSMLNSGEVPNLFEAEDYENVVIACRPAAKEVGIDEANRDGIYEFFINRVRRNLHLVICMSPVGDAFRRRCRMFPSLVNCCTIDWFEKWPEDALLSVALNDLKSIGEDMGGKLAITCVAIHKSVEQMTDRFYNEVRRYYYTTPSSYLELIKVYKSTLKNKKAQLSGSRNRIANGLKKLYETNEMIDSMKETLIALEPELAKKSIAVQELMKHLEVEQMAADKVRVVVKGDEEVAKGKADETQVLADDAQRDLDTAMPALQAATKALESLNKNDINEVKVFQKPPKLVQFVMESVCLLLGAKTDWPTAKIVLGDTNFLKKLQEYDRDHISDLTLKKLKTYVQHPDFTAEKIATVSKACKSMCMWVRAIDMYAKVYRIVEPKRKRLQAAEKELNDVMALLREKQRQLAEVEATIANLEAQFNQTVADKEALEHNIELTSNRLNRAGRLNVALGDEQTRWEETVKKLSGEIDSLIGDVLMAAASIAYLGAFTGNYRAELIGYWETKCKEQGIPTTENFSLITVLADPYTIRLWNSYGLPRDNISTENAILVTQANRWPLMIDPQEQANRWVRQMEGGNNLKVIKLTDADFMRELERGIRLGRPVLLEEVGETLDPILSPVLKKEMFSQAGRLLIRLGDTDVDYDPGFKFYVTTKLPNPHYLPEVCIEVTLVNFTVTPSGLEDQLLADVVRLERPELEVERNELVVRINNDKGQLNKIEDKILHLLYSSEGNILDDENLIETLNESKETSAVIAARLVEAEATEEKISIAREKYRSVATRGSVLYFVVAQLGEIDPMYQYSLKYFSQIFTTVIETTKKDPVLEVRLNILYDSITVAIYTNVSRGLFERHKLVFSFMLCVAIYIQKGIVSEAQWSFLLRGPVGTKGVLPKKPTASVVTDAMWQAANYLSTNYENFQGLPDDVLNSIDIDIGDYHLKIKLLPNAKASPRDWNNALDDFDKLMLIRTIQEEKLVFAITEFVKTKLGQTFIESPQISLDLLYQDTSNAVPLVFVLSTGSDPFGAFQRFAAKMEKLDQVRSISLGQGQGPVAEKMIKLAIETGDWIFLQNCHLATSWMLSMERIVLKIARESDTVHKDFRLYMSSMPNKSFPVAVLQNSVKVTNEPPKGLKANIKRAFMDMQEDFFEDNALEQDWRTMLFGICMFHAIVQERKKFGPLGWNIIYEFNDSDREFAFNTLKMFCAEGFIPWDGLEYLTGEITYGGRVTDYWDLRCLKTILKIFFSPIVLKAGYTYSKSGVYYCPRFEHLDEYRQFIDTLPMIEAPEIFGMHENANIAYQIKETHMVIKTIMESQPRAAGVAEGVSSDDIVYELAENIINTIITVIPSEDVYIHMFKKDDKGRLPSLTTVIVQEVDRYNALLKLIHESMINLKKAIKGLVVMSEALEEIFKAFINNQVPRMWSARSYNSLKSLGSWVRDLKLRLDFISIWLRFGPPTSYWFSGFYFPQGFLTGTLQTHARKYNLPIDALRFDFIIYDKVIDQEDVKKVHDEVGKEVKSIYNPLKAPEDGVIIHGLFIDAGRWDVVRHKLVDAKPGEVNPPMPAMWLKPNTEMKEDDPRYQAPLYKTSIRAGVLSTTGHSTNFVIAVLLPSEKPKNYWILNGTALLTQITD